MSTKLGKVFKAIADPTRRKILDLLREGDMAAGAIADQFKLTKPAISHHLSALKEADLAIERREGQQIIYSLKEDSFVEAWDGFLSKFCTHRRETRAQQKAKRSTKKA